MAEASVKDSEGRPSTRKSRSSRFEGSDLGMDDRSLHSTPRTQSLERVMPSARTSSTQRANPPESKPADRMHASTSSNSNSANASPQPTAGQLASASASASATAGASPYGTRSRNRATNARPNYAEDKDSEMDFEYTTSRASHASAPTTSQPMQRKTSSGSHGRKSTTTNVNHKVHATPPSAATAPREPIPGTSSFSVNDSQSKKRKAPGSGATVAHTSAASQAPHSSTSRKAAQHSAATSSASRENNMVTFESSGAYLSHGCLTADDKTKYKVNGECI